MHVIVNPFRRTFLIYKRCLSYIVRDITSLWDLIRANSSSRRRSIRARLSLKPSDLYFNFLYMAYELIDLHTPNRKVEFANPDGNENNNNHNHHQILWYVDLVSRLKHKYTAATRLFFLYLDFMGRYRYVR